jgi:hypothetical protein
MNYELKRGNLEVARTLFYRAIRSVPWAKCVWLDSIRYLRQALSSSDLSETLALMTEKEIRIRKLPDIE